MRRLQMVRFTKSAIGKNFVNCGRLTLCSWWRPRSAEDVEFSPFL